MKALLLLVAASQLCAQAPDASPTAPPSVPDWALPGSATHTQVPPPLGFHRPGRNFDAPIGIFEGQSDIGAALVPGSASYDSATRQYTIHSAGYNIWYQRDEFRFLWKKMSGDISLAAVMEYVERTPLKGPLPLEKAVEYAGQILGERAAGAAGFWPSAQVATKTATATVFID